jgi:crossover junction endodeoxyribonuclease RusA
VDDGMSEVFFSVLGMPIAQGSKRVVPTKAGPRAIESNEKTLRPWRQEIAVEAQQRMGSTPLWRGPVRVTAYFFMPRPKGHYGTGRNADTLRPSAPRFPSSKPDLDKLLRAVLDALSGIVFADDSQVVSLDIAKLYADGRSPGVTVEVSLREE